MLGLRVVGVWDLGGFGVERLGFKVAGFSGLGLRAP